MVIFWLKIFAMVLGLRFSSLTPFRLNHRDRGHVRQDLDLAATLLSRRQFVVSQEGVSTAEVGPALMVLDRRADGVVVTATSGWLPRKPACHAFCAASCELAPAPRSSPTVRSVALVVAPFVDRTACRDAEGERGSRRRAITRPRSASR